MREASKIKGFVVVNGKGWQFLEIRIDPMAICDDGQNLESTRLKAEDVSNYYKKF